MRRKRRVKKKSFVILFVFIIVIIGCAVFMHQRNGVLKEKLINSKINSIKEHYGSLVKTNKVRNY